MFCWGTGQSVSGGGSSGAFLWCHFVALAGDIRVQAPADALSPCESRSTVDILTLISLGSRACLCCSKIGTSIIFLCSFLIILINHARVAVAFLRSTLSLLSQALISKRSLLWALIAVAFALSVWSCDTFIICLFLVLGVLLLLAVHKFLQHMIRELWFHLCIMKFLQIWNALVYKLVLEIIRLYRWLNASLRLPSNEPLLLF